MQFTLNLWLRESDLVDLPWELSHRHGSPDDPEFLRFGIQFSDGSKWTNLPGPGMMPDFEEEPVGPVVIPQGGGGGSDHWEMRHWLWPLPPPGDLTFVVSWPLHEIHEASATIDATGLIECAAGAETIWPS